MTEQPDDPCFKLHRLPWWVYVFNSFNIMLVGLLAVLIFGRH